MLRQFIYPSREVSARALAIDWGYGIGQIHLCCFRMSTPSKPTREQEIACLRLCVNLTRFNLSIHIVRIDERNGEVYILAGEEVGIIIQTDGIWRYD
jgi:hypothetical protein